MGPKNLKEIYGERIEAFEGLRERQIRILNLISLLRLAVMVLIVWFIVIAVRDELQLFWWIAGLLVILFFTLIGYHKNQSDRKRLLEKLIHLNQQEILCQERNFSDFDDGSSYEDPEHPWSHDLDLFGDRSIYHFLNRTTTHTGPAKLAGLLTTPELDKAVIDERQEVHTELGQKVNFRQYLTANGMLLKPEMDDLKALSGWSKEKLFIAKYPWTKTVAIIISVISTGMIGLLFFRPELYILLLFMVLLNWTLLSRFVVRTNRVHTSVSKKSRFLLTYSRILKIVEQEKFTNPALQDMQAECANGAKAFRELNAILNLFDQRLNFLMGIILNSFFMFDFLMLHRLNRWHRTYASKLEPWFNRIGELDASISIAGYVFNHPTNRFPSFDPKHQGLTAENLGHPMILPGKRVDNSITVGKEKVVLITGANMAGKSTFLRAMGVNMVLTYAGASVQATKFETGDFLLASSMRTTDSLKNDESYFYAEIKRLKGIVEKMEQGTKMLILLDEVLKGTNTTDKQNGSRGLIHKAIQHEVIMFIATHDLVLGELEQQHKGTVVNYCFESYMEELELRFDYTIQPGIAKNMNASFLMRQMGIMD